MPDPFVTFLRAYGAEAVGATPIQPELLDTETDEKPKDVVDRSIETTEAYWTVKPIPEHPPAKRGEYPERFIDGSHRGQPVLCLRSPQGRPIPIVLSEIGAVALRFTGKRFEREYVNVERVVSFVADPFPWEEIESFTAGVLNNAQFPLRFLPANSPDDQKNHFDYEVNRMQAYARNQTEMQYLERLALAVDRSIPSLIDGPLDKIIGNPDPASPLIVGVVKRLFRSHLHEIGYRTLLDLKPGQRTPCIQIDREGSPNVLTWFLKLAGGPRLAPNWGYVRVEIPFGQFKHQFQAHEKDFTMIDRLSRWLIDARCRTESYARMPVSLEPIVRAEETLKPLFTSLPLLVNRLYRSAGLFRGGEA